MDITIMHRNQGYDKNYIGYPPQYQDLGYNNGISYDYNYQTPFAYSHYQERGNDERRPSLADTLACIVAKTKKFKEECSPTFPSTNFQPYEENEYDNWKTFNYNCQMPKVSPHYQEHGKNEGNSHLEEVLAAFIAQSQQTEEMMNQMMDKEEEQLRSLSELPNAISALANQMNNLEFQLGQLASSSYEEPNIEQEEDPSEEEENEDELNDEEREFCELFDEFIEEFKEFDRVELKDQDTNENSHLSFFSRIHDNCLFDEKTNCILPFIVLDDDRSPLEVNEEDPNKERKEDDEIIDEKEEEESHLIDLSNIEQQNQEEANDELKSDMSISKPLNSSICTFFDNTASLDFILPLESFDYKKEVREILGILKRGGRKFTKMMGKFVRRRWNVKGKDDRSMLNKKLIDEEAQ
ncbi:hypothetical protein ACS0TY_014991 [Phlomoides rotata]